VACTLPSDLVIVPKPFGNDVPDAAIALPMTGGQYVAHEPLQLDLAGVSIANQYNVCPWALTSTVPMLVDLVEIVTVDAFELGGADEDDAAGADVGGGLDGGDEVPQAVSTAAAPASTGTAHQRLRISSLRSWRPQTFLSGDYVAQPDSVHHGRAYFGLDCIRWHSHASDIGYR
jgi:hypothetical protein